MGREGLAAGSVRTGSNGSDSTGSTGSNGSDSLQVAQPLTPPSTPALPTHLCNNFKSGFCRWGFKCQFAHIAVDGQFPQQKEGSDIACNMGHNCVWWRPDARLWAHILLHQRHPGFNIVPMLIGRLGGNMTDIFSATNAKLRIRGRGSGHLELADGKEAPVSLMVAVTSHITDPEGVRNAVEMLLARLQEVACAYCTFCEQRGLPQPTSAEPVCSFGEISIARDALLKDLLALAPSPWLQITGTRHTRWPFRAPAAPGRSQRKGLM